MMQIKCGLEIHGYLNMNSKTKLFCDCKTGQEAKPNTNICPICTAQPGSKPMLANEEAIKKIVSVALMLDCKINKKLLFQRKHYSWPDLPAGYQRTMSGSYSTPVGEEGEFLGIGISDIHPEEDPARWNPATGEIDYNRSGLPLAEIVTKPDFKSAEEVRAWLKRLMTTLSYIKAIDPEAGIKADVNISISPNFQRVEIKNVNSFKSIVKAIEYETERQQQEAAAGRKIEQETRMWDDTAGKTVFMRSKEQAMDYMFIPDPDLPMTEIKEEEIKKISKELPEKPKDKIKRYTEKLKIDKTDAEVLASEIILAQIFEETAKEIDPTLAAKWLRRELLRVAHYNKKEIEEIEIDAKQLIKLLKLVETKQITDTVAKKTLEELAVKPFDVEKYVREKDLLAVTDKEHIEELCAEAIAENPKAIEDYKKGNEKALNFIVGQVMKKSKGKATPNEVNEIIKRMTKARS